MEPMQVDMSHVTTRSSTTTTTTTTTPSFGQVILRVFWLAYWVLGALYVVCAFRLVLQYSALHDLVPSSIFSLAFGLLGLLVVLTAVPAVHGAGPVATLPKRSQRVVTGTILRLVWCPIVGGFEAALSNAFTEFLDDAVSEFVEEPDDSINVYLAGTWTKLQIATVLASMSSILVTLMGILSILIICRLLWQGCCEPRSGVDAAMQDAALRYGRGGGAGSKPRCGRSCGVGCASWWGGPRAAAVCCGGRSHGRSRRGSLLGDEDAEAAPTTAAQETLMSAPTCRARCGACMSTNGGRLQCAATAVYCVALLLAICGLAAGYIALYLATRQQPPEIVQADSSVGRADCDPLVPSQCILPFPSSLRLLSSALFPPPLHCVPPF